MNNSDQRSEQAPCLQRGVISDQAQLIPVVMAIIYQDGKYLMQLRDEIPTIVYPGVWGLFGGHIELGESPEVGLKRELIEEINYSPSSLTKFCSIPGGNYLRHFFHCPLTVPISDLELKEGWDLKLLTPEEITQGFAYSQRAIALLASGGYPSPNDARFPKHKTSA